MRVWASLLITALAATGFVQAATPQGDAGIALYVRHQLEAMYPDASGPGAAVLIARGDKVLFKGARGAASVERREGLKADDVFGVGSITKQFVAAGVLKLAEERKLSLDDPISAFIKDYPNGNKITLRQLLNHTSGIKSYTDIKNVVDGPIRKEASTKEVVDSFKREPLNFRPGSSFEYSNSGYVLLGAVIESVTKEPWYVYVERALFRPSGMSHTGYAGSPQEASQIVSGYTIEKGKVMPATYMSVSWAHAAAGMASSLDDLLKWNRRLHNGHLLSPRYYNLMITPLNAPKGGAGYGLGMSVERIGALNAYGHSGVVNGFEACMFHIPGPGITVEVLENNDGGAAGSDPCLLVKRLAIAVIASSGS